MKSKETNETKKATSMSSKNKKGVPKNGKVVKRKAVSRSDIPVATVRDSTAKNTKKKTPSLEKSPSLHVCTPVIGSAFTSSQSSYTNQLMSPRLFNSVATISPASISLTPNSSPHTSLNSSQSSFTSMGNLAAFGIKAAAQVRTTFRDRNSKLKCCVIRGVNMCTVVFKCEPNDTQYTNGSWSEKIFSDAVRSNSSWIKELNFDTEFLYWYQNNVAQKNPKGWPVRMFTIQVEEEPSKDALKKLADYICQQVNQVPRNDTTLTVDDNNFFWIQPPVVWSDIVGYEAAFLMIKKEKGDLHPGFFVENEDYIHTFFHPNSFDKELGRALYAPTRALNPSLQDDDKDQNSSFAPGFKIPRHCAQDLKSVKRQFSLLDDSEDEEGMEEVD